MLKSSLSGDRYDNVTLSNLKILSSTRYHASNKCIDLNYIDSVIRDIKLNDCDIIEKNQNEIEKVEVIDTSIPDVIEIENINPIENEIKEPSIPFIMSIQYSDYMDINNVIESFLRDNYNENMDENINIISNEPCGHCNSIEILHSNKLSQISSWRKSLMNNLQK